MKHRALLFLFLAGAAASCATAPAPSPARPGLVSGAIAPGVELVGGTFTPGQQPDGNSIIIEGRDGVVVIDTGRHAEHTQRVLDAVGSRRIRAVMNTHWHLDHIGGNPRVRAAAPDATFYASDALTGALSGFLANYRKQLVEMSTNADDATKATFAKEIAIIDAGESLKPNVVIDATGPRTLAGRRFDVHLERNAVTGGDLWLLDRSSRIAILGDLVTLPVPFLDTACPAKWSETLARVSREPFDVAIPGHGPSLSHAQFEQYRSAFDALLSCAASDAAMDTCKSGWLNATAGLELKRDDKFTSSLLDYYIGQVLRGDKSRTATLCGQ